VLRRSITIGEGYAEPISLLGIKEGKTKANKLNKKIIKGYK
jgi:hypothetical protein